MKITRKQLRKIIKEAGPSEYEQVLASLEQSVGEMVLDLIYEELTASGLDLADPEIAMKVAAGLDYAKGQLRY